MENVTQIIDPWKSFEIKDYKQIISKFGIEEIGQLKEISKNNYFNRKIIFGHKDLNVIYRAIKNKDPFVMMTGLMPSGKFHFGHKIIADLMIYYQKLGAECYIAVADIESYLTRNITLEKAREIAIEEYLINYIALGLKAKKTKFYFQSTGSKEYMNLSKLISKKTNLNEMRGIYGELSTEKIISALTQVADILHPQLIENGGPKPTIVPVGVDQLPHINITRDIASRMKSEYNFILPSTILSKFMIGLKGGKMSSSDPLSYVSLTETPEEAANKIRKYAFSGGQPTIEEHRKKGGNPDIDVSFQWLRIMFEPDDKKLQKIHDDYKSGKLLTGELKQILIEKVSKFLKEHQKKRERAKKQINKFLF